MKKLYPIFLVSFILLSGVLKAQDNSEWQPSLENPTDGTNGINGIEIYYKLTTCNNLETVLLEVINTNTYAVRAGWNGYVLTNDERHLSRNNQQDSLTIPAKGEVIGDCSGKYPQLLINLNDCGADKYNFQSFLISNFDFIVIH